MDFMRKAGSWIKGAAGKVFGVAKRGSDWVKGVYDKATKIPVIGNFIRTAGDAVKNMRIPDTPITVGQALGAADKIINVGNKLTNG